MKQLTMFKYIKNELKLITRWLDLFKQNNEPYVILKGIDVPIGVQVVNVTQHCGGLITSSWRHVVRPQVNYDWISSWTKI